MPACYLCRCDQRVSAADFSTQGMEMVTQQVSGKHTLRRYLASPRGNLSIATALTFVPFMMFVSAAVDMSNAVRMKAELQAAADSGVLASATALASGESDTDKKKIADNGFYANLSPKLLATLTATPVTTVDFPTKKVHMTVQVETRQVLTRFLADTMKLGVEAEAVVDKGDPICMMSMSKTKSQSLMVKGTADIVADGCAVQVNSSADDALYQTGSATATAKSFCVNGGYSAAAGTLAPKPDDNCRQEKDPLAAQFATDLASLGDITTCTKNNLQVKSDTTISPGVYCGGIDLKQDTLTLQPGTYVVRDGEFHVSAGATLKGTGVTILLAGDSSTRFDNQGGANIYLSAPTGGAFSGIVMSQLSDSVPDKDNIVTGGGTVEITGIMYFPAQPISIQGNGVIGDTTHQFAIMADTISVQGTGQLTIHISSDYASMGLPPLPEAHEKVRLAY